MSEDDRARRWELVVPHRDRLLAIARRTIRDSGDAEACVHEAMARCVEFPRLNEGNVLGFLVATTSRLCIDHHRRNARDGRLAVRIAGRTTVEPAPDEAVCDRAEAAWVSARLADLPDRQRHVVLARADGQSPAEIAETLSVSYKSVETLLYRARARARLELERSYGLLLVALARRPRSAGWTAAGVVSVAFVTTASLLGGGPHAAPPTRLSLPDTVVVVPRTAESPVAPGPAPRPGAGARDATPTPAPDGRSPSPTPFRCPSPPYTADPCVAPDPSETPGMYLVDCIRYGVDTDVGFRCRSASPTPSPTRTDPSVEPEGAPR